MRHSELITVNPVERISQLFMTNIRKRFDSTNTIFTQKTVNGWNFFAMGKLITDSIRQLPVWLQVPDASNVVGSNGAKR